MISRKKLKKDLLSAGILQRGNFVFASGSKANQKLDWECIRSDSQVFKDVAYEMSLILSAKKADLVLAVPNGANELARLVSDLAQLKYIEVLKNGKGDFICDKKIEADARIAIIDDILTTGTNQAKMCSSLNLAPVFGVVVWDRSNSSTKLKVGYEVKSLIKEYIPAMVCK